MKSIIIFLFLIIGIFRSTEGALKRCFTCRSRGDLGTCKDPFKMNISDTELVHGIEASPCASGWCGKMLEGGDSFKDDDYGIATQRMCLQRGPNDNEERCANTVWNYKKVYMCFCQGDLCNSSLSSHRINLISAFIPILLVFINKFI